MKLDMEIIRSILLVVQQEGKGRLTSSHNIEFDDLKSNDENAIYAEHFRLLIEEAKYIHGKVMSTGFDKVTILVEDLTWEGHQFLANAQNEKVWDQFKDWLAEKGGSVSISVAQSILIEIAKRVVFQ